MCIWPNSPKIMVQKRSCGDKRHHQRYRLHKNTPLPTGTTNGTVSGGPKKDSLDSVETRKLAIYAIRDEHKQHRLRWEYLLFYQLLGWVSCSIYEGLLGSLGGRSTTPAKAARIQGNSIRLNRFFWLLAGLENPMNSRGIIAW